MDTHQCLDFRSCHPSHFKRNIPFNMAWRIYKTITAKTLRSKHLEELNIFLQRQKYSIKLINARIKRASQILCLPVSQWFQQRGETCFCCNPQSNKQGCSNRRRKTLFYLRTVRKYEKFTTFGSHYQKPTTSTES